MALPPVETSALVRIEHELPPPNNTKKQAPLLPSSSSPPPAVAGGFQWAVLVEFQPPQNINGRLQSGLVQWWGRDGPPLHLLISAANSPRRLRLVFPVSSAKSLTPLARYFHDGNKAGGLGEGLRGVLLLDGIPVQLHLPQEVCSQLLEASSASSWNLLGPPSQASDSCALYYSVSLVTRNYLVEKNILQKTTTATTATTSSNASVAPTTTTTTTAAAPNFIETNHNDNINNDIDYDDDLLLLDSIHNRLTQLQSSLLEDQQHHLVGDLDHPDYYPATYTVADVHEDEDILLLPSSTTSSIHDDDDSLDNLLLYADNLGRGGSVDDGEITGGSDDDDDDDYTSNIQLPSSIVKEFSSSSTSVPLKAKQKQENKKRNQPPPPPPPPPPQSYSIPYSHALCQITSISLSLDTLHSQYNVSSPYHSGDKSSSSSSSSSSRKVSSSSSSAAVPWTSVQLVHTGMSLFDWSNNNDDDFGGASNNNGGSLNLVPRISKEQSASQKHLIYNVKQKTVIPLPETFTPPPTSNVDDNETPLPQQSSDKLSLTLVFNSKQKRIGSSTLSTATRRPRKYNLNSKTTTTTTTSSSSSSSHLLFIAQASIQWSELTSSSKSKSSAMKWEDVKVPLFSITPPPQSSTTTTTSTPILIGFVHITIDFISKAMLQRQLLDSSSIGDSLSTAFRSGMVGYSFNETGRGGAGAGVGKEGILKPDVARALKRALDRGKTTTKFTSSSSSKSRSASPVKQSGGKAAGLVDAFSSTNHPLPVSNDATTIDDKVLKGFTTDEIEKDEEGVKLSPQLLQQEQSPLYLYIHLKSMRALAIPPPPTSSSSSSCSSSITSSSVLVYTSTRIAPPPTPPTESPPVLYTHPTLTTAASHSAAASASLSSSLLLASYQPLHLAHVICVPISSSSSSSIHLQHKNGNHGTSRSSRKEGAVVVEVWVLDTSSDSSDYPIRREKQQQQPVGSHPEVSAFTRVSKQVNPIDGAGSGGSGVGGFWSNSISTSSSSSDGGSTGARLLGLVKLPVGCLYDAAAATTLNDVSNESGDVKLEFKAAAGVLPYMVPLTEYPIIDPFGATSGGGGSGARGWVTAELALGTWTQVGNMRVVQRDGNSSSKQRYKMDDDEDDPVPIPPVSPKKRHSPFYSKHYTTRTDNSNDPSVATLPVSDSIINESESRAALRDADYDRTTVIFDVVADHNLIDDDEGGDHDDGESVLLPDDAFTASNKEVVHEEEEGLDDDKSLGECDLHVAIYRACGVKALVGAAMERFKVSGKEKTHDSAVTASTTTSAVLDSDLEFAYSAGANTFITLRLFPKSSGDHDNEDQDEEDEEEEIAEDAALCTTDTVAESFTPVYNHAEILTLAHVDSALVNWIRGGGCATGTIWMATPSYSHTANSSSSLPHWSATARKSRVALAKFSVPLRDIVTRPGGLDRVWVALSPPSTKPPSSATSSSRAAVQLSIKFTSGLDFGSSNSGGGGVDASISAAPLDFGAVSTSSLTDVQTLEDNSNVGILPPKAPSGTTRPVKVKFVFDRVVVPSRIVLASSSPSSLPTYEPVKSVYLSWKYPVVVVHSSRTVYYETGRTPNIHLSAPADATSNYTSINIDYSTSIDLDMTSQMFAWFRDNLLQICVVANTSDYDSAHSGMDTNSQMHVGTAHIDLWEIMKLVRRRRNLSRSSKGIASPADYMLINPESVDLGGCILSASFTASGGTPSSVSFSADSLPVATNAARPSRAPLLSSSSSSIAQHSQSQLQTHSASSPHTETMSSSGELLPPSRKNIQVSSRSPIPSQDQLSSSSNLQQSMAALEDKNYITFSIIVKKVSNIAGLSSSSEDPSKSPVMHVAFECVTSGGESAGERTWRTNPSTTRKWDQQTFKVRMPLSAVRAIKSTTTSSSPNNSPTMSAVFQLWCSNAINQGGNSTINSSTMQCLGKAVVDLSPLVAGLEFIDGWYHLVHETGQQVGEISVKIVPSVPLGPPPNFSSSLSSSTPGRSVDGNYYHQSPFLYKTTTSSSSPYRSQHVQTFSRNPNFTNNPSNATADTIEQVRKSWGESLKNLAELNEKMKLALASSAAAGAPAMKSLANPSSISHVGIDRMTRSKISPIKKVDVATFVDEVSIAEEELEELVDMAEEMKSVLDETFSLFGDITDGPASSCARLEEAESVEDMDVDSNQQQSSCSSDGGGGANLPTLDNSLENLLMDEIIESAASSHQPGDSNFSPTNVVWPPPHDSTENLAQLGSFKIKTASGRFWCLHGGALALYSGTPVVVRMNKEANLYRTSETWITLQDCQSDRFVRQSDYLLWDKDFGPDVGVAHDFAFMFYPQPDGSFRILNAHGGGYYVGYDQYQDRVMIVAPGDSRIVNWILDFTVADALDDEKSSSLASSGGEIIDGDGGGRHDISDVVESAALDLNIGIERQKDNDLDETVVGTVNDTPTQLKCVSPSPESPVLESSQLNSLPLGSLLFTPGSADELSVIKLYAPLSVHQDDKEPLSSTSSSIANILDHYRTVSASCTAAKNTSPTTGSTDSHNNSSFFDNYLLHHPEALVVASSSVPSQKLVGFKDGTKLISSLANGKAKASTTNATRSPSPPGRLRSTSSPEIPASSSASNNIQAKAASFTKEEIDRISSIFSGTK